VNLYRRYRCNRPEDRYPLKFDFATSLPAMRRFKDGDHSSSTIIFITCFINAVSMVFEHSFSFTKFSV